MLGTDDLSTTEHDEIRQTIIDWTDELVSLKHDAWLERWAEDAVLMAPGAPRIVGHKELAKFAAAFEPTPGYRFENWEFAGAGDMAIVCNQIILTGNSQPENQDAYFNQIIVLSRKEQIWKIQAVIFTPTSP